MAILDDLEELPDDAYVALSILVFEEAASEPETVWFKDIVAMLVIDHGVGLDVLDIQPMSLFWALVERVKVKQSAR